VTDFALPPAVVVPA